MKTLRPNELEQRLSDHYLRSDGPLGSAPLRFLDARDAELSEALDCEANEVRSIFLGSFSPLQVRDVFSIHSAGQLSFEREHPGWFRYIVLSCVIAATSSGVSNIGDFRSRLTEALRTEVSFSDLSGIALMWHELHRWCEKRRQKGEPFRAIELPHPGAWTQIGHTLKISFPSRRDLDRISQHINLNLDDLSDPTHVIRIVLNRLHAVEWSDGFKAAFQDFRDKAISGQRFIAEHPFLAAIREGSGLPKTQSEVGVCSLEISTDIDGRNTASLRIPNEQARRGLGIDDSPICITINTLIEILEKLRGPLAQDELVKSYTEGVIPFIDGGLDSWEFKRTPELGYVRLLIKPSLVAKLRPTQQTTDEWFLTNPAPVEPCLAILRRIRPELNKLGQPILPRPTISGGIKIETNYLGLPLCLPTIKASDTCVVNIRPSEVRSGSLRIQTHTGSEIYLGADEKLDGRWIAEITEQGTPIVNLNIKFISVALEHDTKAYNPDETKWRPEISVEGTPLKQKVSEIAAAEDQTDSEFPAIFEALYAGGANGWAETDLLQLLKKATLGLQLQTWDVIRVLHDAGWLEPRLSTGWGTRRWFLRQPKVVAYGKGLFVLEGSSNESIRAKFINRAIDAGAQVYKRQPSGMFSVPTLFCRLKNISADPDFELQSVNNELLVPSLSGRIAFKTVQASESQRSIQSVWSWKKKRFVSPAEDKGSICIERLAHNGGKSTDVYKVTNSDGTSFLYDTRSAAIIAAHMTAKVHMFEYIEKNNLLIRATSDGALPREISEFVRRKTGLSPSIVNTEDGNKYAYFMNNETVHYLEQWLGHAILSKQTGRLNTFGVALTRRLGPTGQYLAKNLSRRGQYAPR